MSFFVFKARNNAFSAPRICTVEAGCLARLMREPQEKIHKILNILRTKTSIWHTKTACCYQVTNFWQKTLVTSKGTLCPNMPCNLSQSTNTVASSIFLKYSTAYKFITYQHEKSTVPLLILLLKLSGWVPWPSFCYASSHTTENDTMKSQWPGIYNSLYSWSQDSTHKNYLKCCMGKRCVT